MKNLRIVTFLAFVALLIGAQHVEAAAVIKPVPETTATTASTKTDKQTKKQLKRQERFEKRMAKFEAKMEKKGVDFSDPVDKWLWFAIFGWGAAIVLTILIYAIGFGGFGAGFGFVAIFALLSWLAWLFGGISFIVWLVKKLS